MQEILPITHPTIIVEMQTMRTQAEIQATTITQVILPLAILIRVEIPVITPIEMLTMPLTKAILERRIIP